ncbi:hypothetical protein ACFFON_08725 [Arthrobacter citreus]|uniref:hypothetical protein n=1 Tax=Arthrobacter TaxID=1663 RepID=UPI0012659DB0|nr:hypothetical protein [Arthrobacter gandavensis]
MALRDEHTAIRGSSEERALLLLTKGHFDGSPSVHALRDSLGQAEGQAAYQRLKELGYIESEVSLGGEAVLTSRGRQLGSYIVSLQGRGGPERNDAVRKALLSFLNTGATIGSCADFVDTPGASAFGIPFSNEEILEAADWLKEHRLMDSLNSWQQSHLRPTILPAGREALFSSDQTIENHLRAGTHGGTVNDYRNYGNSVNGNVGAIQQGDQNTANVTTTNGVENRASILDAVTELMNVATSVQDPRLNSQIADLRNTVEDNNTTKEGLLAKASTALATALGAAAGTTSGQQIVAGLQRLIQLIVG